MVLGNPSPKYNHLLSQKRLQIGYRFAFLQKCRKKVMCDAKTCGKREIINKIVGMINLRAEKLRKITFGNRTFDALPKIREGTVDYQLKERIEGQNSIIALSPEN